MKHQFPFLPACLYALFFGAFVMLFGCRPLVLPLSCNELPINNQLPELILRKVTVDSLEKNPDSLRKKSSEEYLAIDLELSSLYPGFLYYFVR